MAKIKTAVIGVGYLGKFHAQKYAALDNSELIAVVDANPETAKEIADTLSVHGLTDYSSLLGNVDAVSIAAPTSLHYKIAKDFLEHGTHVLIEKPITVTVEEADELIELAKQNEAIIQVGFLERFNAAILKLDRAITEPRFIESHRLAPFNPRANDVNVVLDLMIHDIDIILNIVKSELTAIRASGASVLTETSDIVNARLEFANGCVANVTASRVSVKTERKMRIFQNESCATVDFQNRGLYIYQKGEGLDENGMPHIIADEQSFENNDALMEEIKAFLNSIETKTPAVVTGEDGRQALDTAIQISKLLSE
ncbi:Gfo/Idh/MocA family oxidoreductase [Aliikangiella marina]|uniref:Gfo/Idh/MocA family oxidoreductase n=1 Tax=Aliikangiella marina TaxID=1712262 RepID=A0A545TDV8_9GAMM|nr:Gfo/Idh/MocA family oxidoreductase [Aliikangiella marina]TQV75412.1 Gfo/Idh/MocA family oxidoreductase [Aliikangiella marina]